MGRKAKYVLNSEGKYQCPHCFRSYESKPRLLQRIKFKHSNKVTQLQELVISKSRTQTLLLEVVQMFLQKLEVVQNDFVEKAQKMRTELNQTVDRVIVLNRLSILFFNKA